MFESLHYKPRKISEISKSDSRVAVIGTIKEMQENGFILKDETKEIEIAFDGSAERGKLVRVFCSVIDGKLKADVIQDMHGLDLNLFKKVEELYNKTGV